jgi:hypothetical protein
MLSRLVLLALAAATSPQQFDLVCTGDTKADFLATPSPYRVTLHVDLTARKWCEDKCGTIRDIAEVQPSLIYFEKASAEDKLLHNERNHFVNRESGGYIDYVNERIEAGSASFRSMHFTQGTCKAAPFSGFPEIKTKF